MAAKPSSKPARRPITREEMLAPRRTKHDVDMSEHYGPETFFKMRGLSVREVAQVKDASTDPETGEQDTDLYRVLLIAACSVDPALTPDDAQAMLDQNPVIIHTLYEGALQCIALAADVETATATFPAGRDG